MTGFTYKSYNFVDKDPIIDFIRTVVQNSGLSYAELEIRSGVHKQTISNWLFGSTKRPQAASLNAVLRACGYKLTVDNINAQNVIIPTPIIPKARNPKILKFTKRRK